MSRTGPVSTTLTINQVAERIGVHPATVRKMCRRYLAVRSEEWGLRPPGPGEIPAVRLGDPARGKIVIPMHALEKMGL